MLRGKRASRVDILIVEDDEQMQAALLRLVSRMGYAPRGARTFDDAVTEVDRAAPQVLITDWDLGGLRSGIDIAALALERRADCKVMFCSGNNLTVLRLQTSHLAVCRYVRKPISLLEFRSTVGAVLDSL